MDRNNLRRGADATYMTLLVGEIKTTPTADVRSHKIYASTIIEISQYNLDDVLVQLIEDFGEEKLIERIKSLK